MFCVPRVPYLISEHVSLALDEFFPKENEFAVAEAELEGQAHLYVHAELLSEVFSEIVAYLLKCMGVGRDYESLCCLLEVEIGLQWPCSLAT